MPVLSVVLFELCVTLVRVCYYYRYGTDRILRGCPMGFALSSDCSYV